MKLELQQDIKVVKNGLGNLQQQLGSLSQKVDSLEQRMERGFEEARQHRQALQEDLEATISMQAKHQKKLEKI